MRKLILACVVVGGVGLLGCGSGDGSGAYGSPTPSAATNVGGPTLIVMNFLNWCSVEINGGSPSTGATVTASVTPGSMATVVATPASGSFQIGADPWFGVDQNDGGAAPGTDNGAGTGESSTAVVTITRPNASWKIHAAPALKPLVGAVTLSQ